MDALRIKGLLNRCEIRYQRVRELVWKLRSIFRVYIDVSMKKRGAISAIISTTNKLISFSGEIDNTYNIRQCLFMLFGEISK